MQTKDKPHMYQDDRNSGSNQMRVELKILQKISLQPILPHQFKSILPATESPIRTQQTSSNKSTI